MNSTCQWHVELIDTTEREEYRFRFYAWLLCHKGTGLCWHSTVTRHFPAIFTRIVRHFIEKQRDIFSTDSTDSRALELSSRLFLPSRFNSNLIKPNNTVNVRPWDERACSINICKPFMFIHSRYSCDPVTRGSFTILPMEDCFRQSRMSANDMQ